MGALVLDERKEVVKGKALVTVAARYCVWRSWGYGLNYDIGDLSDIWNYTLGICTCGKIERKALDTVTASYCVWRYWGYGLHYDIGDLSDIWNCTFVICTCGKI